MQDKTPKPQPVSNERQKDDNIDEFGRKPDGTELDQPGAAEPAREDTPDTRTEP
jgi:hypothetical protein